LELDNNLYISYIYNNSIFLRT